MKFWAIVLGLLYLAFVVYGLLRIHIHRARRPARAATMKTFLLAAGSLIVVPAIGIIIEAICVAVAVVSVFSAPFTLGGTLLIALAVVVGIFLEFVSCCLAVAKLFMVCELTVVGGISDDKAGTLIGTSYIFALAGVISIGAIGELFEFSEIGEMADLEGLADLDGFEMGDLDGLSDVGGHEIAEIDGEGFGPADSTYGDPSIVDGDPRTSHYVEGYERADGSWVDGHWKSKTW